MSTVSTTIASLTVTAGPDRGKTFALHEEFVHVGRAEDCQIILTDPQIEEVQASLANRNGRFAIITALEGTVAIDGKALPPEHVIQTPKDRKAAEELIKDFDALHRRCEEQLSSYFTPMGSEMYYRYQEWLIDEAKAVLGGLLRPVKP